MFRAPTASCSGFLRRTRVLWLVLLLIALLALIVRQPAPSPTSLTFAGETAVDETATDDDTVDVKLPPKFAHDVDNSNPPTSSPLPSPTPPPEPPMTVAQRILDEWEQAHDAKSGWSVDIPKMVHMTWKSRSLPPIGQECMEQWTSMNPDHTVLLWTDADADELVSRHFHHLRSLYRSLPRGVMRADLFRYMVLATFGGVYADMDVCPLKPIRLWTKSTHSGRHAQVGAIIGVESDTDRADWAEWYSRQLQLCQWALASVPGHPIFTGVVAASAAKLRAKWDRRGNRWPADVPDKIIELTGPAVFTDTALAYIGRFGNVSFDALHNLPEPRMFGDVMLHSITAFSPGVGHMNAHDVDHPQALAKHNFLGSWKGKDSS